jgi:hypothetical protein
VAVSLGGFAAYAAISGAISAAAPQQAPQTPQAVKAPAAVAEEDVTAPQSEQLYKVVATYDFVALAADQTLTLGDAAGQVYNNANSKTNATYYATTPGMEAMAFQAVLASNKGWSLVAGKGLVMGTGAGRCAALTGLVAGQVVDFYWTVSSGLELYVSDRGNTEKAASSISAAKDTLLWDETGHARFLMKEDGAFGFEFNKKANAVTKIEVSSPADYVTTSSWDFKALAGDATAITYLNSDKDYAKVGQSGWSYASVITKEFGTGLAFTRLANSSKQYGFWLRNQGSDDKRGLVSNSQSHTLTVYGLAAGNMVTLSTASADTITAYNASADVKWTVTAVNDTCTQYTMETDGDLNLQMPAGLYITALSISELTLYENTGTYDFETLAKKAEGKSYFTTQSSHGVVGQSGWKYESYTTAETGEGIAYARLASGNEKGFYLNNTTDNAGLTSGTGDYAISLIGLSNAAYVTIETNSATALTGTFVGNFGGTSQDLTPEGSSTFKYRMTSDGDFNVIMAKGAYVKKISVNSPVAAIELPTITTVGESYDTVTVTLAIATEGAEIHYTISDGEELTYTEPFQLTSSATISAWGVADGKSGKTATLDIVAGKIIAPTVAITKVNGINREVTMASTTPDAIITYFVNDAEEALTYDAPLTIAEETKFAAVATRGEFGSDTTTVTLAAGTELQLNGVTFSVAASNYEDETLKDMVLTTDQSSVVCTPAAQITYHFVPFIVGTGYDESQSLSGTVASGTTLKALPYGMLTAVAKAEGYVDADTASLKLKQPANPQVVRRYDFSRAAWGGHTTDLTVTISNPVDTINGTTYGTLAFDGTLVDGVLVQTGTTWLKRGGYDGFYQMNGGARTLAVQNIEAGNSVSFYGRTGNGDFSLTMVDNGVAEPDVIETLDGSVYTFTGLQRGTLAVSMARYGYLDSIVISNNMNAPMVPTIHLDSVNGSSRFVSFTASPEDATITYAYGAKIGDKVIWGKDVIYQGGLVELSGIMTLVRARTWTADDVSDYETRAFEKGTIQLNQPVITYVGATAAGKQFVITVDNSKLVDANPPQGIYYTLPGAEPVAYTDTITVPNTVYGWLTAVSQQSGFDTSVPAYRYLDARDSYAETYVAVTTETNTLPAEAGDLEIADIATIDAALNEAFKPAGRIYFHKAVHAGYNSLVLPFALTTANLESGAVKVTDETGKSLTRGTDYEVVRLQASTSFSTLAADLAAGTLAYTGNLVANTNAYLLKVADALVGHELIFVSGEAAQTLSINKVDLSTVPAEGKWLVKNNATFAPVVAEVPVYLVNEEGTALVRQEAGAVVPPYSYAVIAAESFTDEQIPLIGSATGIDNLQMELQESGLIFDLQGRRVTEPKAGNVYFRNGKKFMQR